MSSRNTGNQGLPMKCSVIVQFMIAMINFLCHCSDKLRSKAVHFKPEKISSQVTFLKSRLIMVCRILQIVSHSITFYQMQLQNLFHFTKCDPFYQMWSILPNVFHFTKCVPFYQMCSILTNVFHFTKCSILLNVFKLCQMCSVLQNLFPLIKFVQFFQMCSILPNLFHFTKSIPFNQICLIYQICSILPNLSHLSDVSQLPICTQYVAMLPTYPDVPKEVQYNFWILDLLSTHAISNKNESLRNTQG